MALYLENNTFNDITVEADVSYEIKSTQPPLPGLEAKIRPGETMFIKTGRDLKIKLNSDRLEIRGI